MNKNNIIREKTFNKNEYDKQYKKDNYTQIIIRPKKEIAERINNYCTDNNINRSQFIIKAVQYIIDNNIDITK